MGYFKSLHTANPVLLMKTGIPSTHILTGKTCFNHREPALITRILFTLQGTCFQNRWFSARPLFYPVRDCNLPTLKVDVIYGRFLSPSDSTKRAAKRLFALRGTLRIPKMEPNCFGIHIRIFICCRLCNIARL
jgi:hypothetical protein